MLLAFAVPILLLVTVLRRASLPLDLGLALLPQTLPLILILLVLGHTLLLFINPLPLALL